MPIYKVKGGPSGPAGRGQAPAGRAALRAGPGAPPRPQPEHHPDV